MKKFYAAAKNLNHPVKWIAGAFYCAMSVCIAILSGKKNCRIQYSASGGPWRSSNGSINWARKVCLGLLLIVGFTVFPGMHPAWTHDSGSHTAMAQPVLSTHCPHIRQWWQLWGNRENGNYRCPKGQSVRIRFSDDQLQTHTGRLYFEFKGKRNGSDDEYRVWVETVSVNGSPLARYPLTLKTENGLSEGFLNVPGFGLDVSDAYLVIQYSPGSTGIPYGDFSYSSIFVFERSVGGENIPWKSRADGKRPKNDEKVGFEVYQTPAPNEQVTTVAPKIYTVRNPDQKTTTMEENETEHGWWEWHWGDGSVTYDRDPMNTVGTLEKVFDKVGEYVVKAISYSKTGEKIREKVWHLVLDATSIHLPQSFNFETIGLVNPDIRIIGPKAWVTGRPARYRVTVDYVEPPFGETVITSIKPSENFQMVWDHAGKQTLTVAVACVTTYKFPQGGQISIRNVYTRSMEVDVATLSISK